MAFSSERLEELLERQVQLMERGLEQRDRVRAQFGELYPEAWWVGFGMRTYNAAKDLIF